MANLQLTGISYRAHNINSSEGDTYINPYAAEAIASCVKPILLFDGVANITINSLIANAIATAIGPFIGMTVGLIVPVAEATSSITDPNLPFRTIRVPAGVPIALYAARGSNLTNTNFYKVDETTAATTTIGSVGDALTGLAQDPTTGIVYGASSGYGPSPRSLYTINLLTGVGTLIAPFLFAPYGPSEYTIADIAFDSNGQLYGWSESDDDLAVINKADAEILFIRSSGLGTYGDGMDFNSSNELWVCPEGSSGPFGESIYKIDPDTGNILDQKELYGATGIYISEAITSGSFDSNDVFWAVINGRNSQSELITIDTSTGEITEIGLVPSKTDALMWLKINTTTIASASNPIPKINVTTIASATADGITPNIVSS